MTRIHKIQNRRHIEGTSQPVNGVMKSLEEEIGVGLTAEVSNASCSKGSEVDSSGNCSPESRIDLDYLLEASDDELGILPIVDNSSDKGCCRDILENPSILARGEYERLALWPLEEYGPLEFEYDENRFNKLEAESGEVEKYVNKNGGGLFSNGEEHRMRIGGSGLPLFNEEEQQRARFGGAPCNGEQQQHRAESHSKNNDDNNNNNEHHHDNISENNGEGEEGNDNGEADEQNDDASNTLPHRKPLEERDDTGMPRSKSAHLQAAVVGSGINKSYHQAQEISEQGGGCKHKVFCGLYNPDEVS